MSDRLPVSNNVVNNLIYNGCDHTIQVHVELVFDYIGSNSHPMRNGLRLINP